MPPQPDLTHFLKRYEQHQAELAAQLTPEQAFAESQFKTVTEALGSATKAMTKFLKTYHPTTSVDNFPSKISTPDVLKVVSAVKTLETALKPLKPDNSDVVKGLKSLQGEVASLQDIKTETVAISNLKEVTSNFSIEINGVINAIKAQETKVNVAAPKVTVQPTPVTVQPTDVKGLVKAMNAVQKTITELIFPVANTPTDPLILYAEADIDDTDTTGALKPVRYFGYTDNHAAWYIKKFDTTGQGLAAAKTIRFAFGQSNYSTNWTNRASLTYSLWGS